MRTARLLATGGTIASRSGPRGRVPGACGRDLLAQAVLPADLRVDVWDMALPGSFSWSLADLHAVVRKVREALSDDVDGVVVAHGTDTMEESVFLTSLLVGDDRPVVFTGAQRPFDDPAPDGPANLADAFTVAIAEAARGRGPLLCFDGRVFAARGVTKVDTLGAHAFAAPGRGPVLRVHGGRVTATAPPRRPLTAAEVPGELPRVDVVALYVGADDRLLRAAVATGARGVVLAAFGAGNANPAVCDAVAELGATGVPVLVCSRVVAGSVAPLYGGGGGADLARAGAAFGGDLTPWQARLLLSVALACFPTEPLRYVAKRLEH